MPQQTGRFQWVVKLALVGMIGTLAILGLAVIVSLFRTVGIFFLGRESWPLAVNEILLILAELAGMLWTVALYGVIRVMVTGESGIRSAADRLSSAESLLEDAGGSLRKLIDLASLSDQAKSLIFRDREVEALHETIQEDLMRQDYASAEVLISSLEKRLGYADEAARLRKEIEAGKKATLEEKIDGAIARLQDIINHHDWARAMRAAQKMAKQFPDHPKAKSLPERVEAARIKHKRALLQEYGEAVRKNDVDRGIELLKELDRYLTPQEAAALAESARGVFRAKLQSLGVQFAINVTDQQWAAALATGEQIINEFPNTRMAQEVREKMDQLKSHAAAKA